MTAKIAIRSGIPEDRRFVCDSFSREYAKTPHGRPLGERLSKELAGRLIDRWTLAVACPTDGGDTVYAWLLYSPDGTAWAHVKPEYRGKGFFRALRDSVDRPLTSMYQRPGHVIRELLSA